MTDSGDAARRRATTAAPASRVPYPPGTGARAGPGWPDQPTHEHR
jgi:hypothetical protein